MCRHYASPVQFWRTLRDARYPPVDSYEERYPMRFPLTITDLRGGIAVVVGGGVFGVRKVRSLLAAGVTVRLISPTGTDQLQDWAADNQSVWEQRHFTEADT